MFAICGSQLIKPSVKKYFNKVLYCGNLNIDTVLVAEVNKIT